MAQKRFFEWKTPASSFDHGLANQGILPAGRYKGFDTLTDGGGVGINITLSHAGDAFKTIEDDLSSSANKGVFVTPQGKIIHIDAAVGPLAVSDGPGGNARIDYIIAEHEHVESVGGQDAIFSVIEGPANGTEPTIPNPAKQILLARMVVAAGATTFAGITVTYPDPPTFNAIQGLAFLDKMQQFTKLQASYKEGTVLGSTITPGDVDYASVTLENDGNYFLLPNWGNDYPLGSVYFPNIDGGYPPEGTVIMLRAQHTFNLVTAQNFDPESGGFQSETDYPSTTYFKAYNGTIIIIRYTGTGSEWELVGASQSLAQAIQLVENEVDTLQSDVTALESEMATAQGDINALEGYMEFPGFSLVGSPMTGDNGSSISNFDNDDHQINQMGDMLVVNFNASFDIATAAPSTLSFDLTLFNANTPTAKSVALGYMDNGSTELPVYMECNGSTDTIEITRVDGGSFATGTWSLKGQLIIACEII